MRQRSAASRAFALWALLAVSAATRASAGDLPWDQAKEFGAVSVRDRSREAYSPLGIRIGNYVLLPELDFRTTFVGDNQPAATSKSRDLRTGVGAGFELRSQFQRHMLDLLGAARVNVHEDGATLDYIDGKLRALGRIDIDHANSAFGEVSIERNHDDAVDSERPNGASEPTAVTISRAEAGYRYDTGRIDASIGARYVRYDYTDTQANDGSVIDQDARDLSALRPFASLGVRFSPGYRIFAEAGGKIEENRGDALVDRDARALEGAIGIEMELTPLVHLKAKGGYVTQDYLQSSLRDFSTFTYQAELQWFVSPLVSLTFGTQRQANATSFAAASGRIATSYHVRADYEFRRNLLVAVEGSYREIDYIGEARADSAWVGRIGLEYFANRNWVFTLGYEHQELKSTMSAFDRELDKISLGVKYRY